MSIKSEFKYYSNIFYSFTYFGHAHVNLLRPGSKMISFRIIKYFPNPDE